MPYVELLAVPRDAEALVNYLQQNFRRISDALARTPGYVDDDDIKITSSARGLVLTSPDGSEFRLVVDNSGNLTTTPA